MPKIVNVIYKNKAYKAKVISLKNNLKLFNLLESKPLTFLNKEKFDKLDKYLNSSSRRFKKRKEIERKHHGSSST
tara:strand:- start:1802 stop:2026 length:225 start_codon:yes stop_codon:yes gene_type:complete